jgi:hypothetical protein
MGIGGEARLYYIGVASEPANTRRDEQQILRESVTTVVLLNEGWSLARD